MAYVGEYNDVDVEKRGGLVKAGSDDSGSAEKRQGSFAYENGAVPGESFEYGDSLYAKLQRFAAKFHVELRGIERVPEDERTDTGFRGLLNVSTMVCAA